MGKRGPVAKMATRTPGKAVAMSRDYFPPPSHLSPLACEYWHQTVTAFPEGHFTAGDAVLLEQYAEAAALHQTSKMMLRKEGRKYKDRNGVWRPHPAVADQDKACLTCAMLATKLRITKQAITTPKAAGRAAHDAAQSARGDWKFEDLLFQPEQ